jgi:hypothetical protein
LLLLLLLVFVVVVVYCCSHGDILPVILLIGLISFCLALSLMENISYDLAWICCCASKGKE